MSSAPKGSLHDSPSDILHADETADAPSAPFARQNKEFLERCAVAGVCQVAAERTWQRRLERLSDYAVADLRVRLRNTFFSFENVRPKRLSVHLHRSRTIHYHTSTPYGRWLTLSRGKPELKAT